MRKFFGVALAVAGAFLFVPAAHAQFTTVTATVKDPNGIPYAGGTMSAVLVPGASGGYTLNGAPYSGQVGPVTLDSTGKFIANFGDVTMITPGSPQWRITIDSNQGGIESPLGTGGQTFIFTSTGTTISGSSPVDISTSLNALAPKLTNITVGGGSVTSVSATSPIVATPNPITGAGTLSCPACNTSSATIAGSIATGQVAFGTGANTIGGVGPSVFGSPSFFWDNTNDFLTVVSSGSDSVGRDAISVQNSSVPTGNQNEMGIFSLESSSLTVSTSGNFYGIEGATLIGGNFTVSGVVAAVAGQASVQSSLTAGVVTDFLATPVSVTSAATATRGVGFYSQSQSGASTTFNAAFYSENQGSTAGNFAYYSVGGKNFLGGPQGTELGGPITLDGSTSGSATLGVAAIAGTPNQINLPTTTGSSGQFLQTNGANPQQTTWATPSTVATAVPLSGITAATGSNTIASGNNPQTWNWALTTDAIDAMQFGETSAATGGTLTNGLANQALLMAATATNSTATPFELVQGSITNTVATPLMQLETTWNNAGLTAAGIVLNVTNTASAAGSLLENLQVGNVSQWKVTEAGNATALGTQSAASYLIGATTVLALPNSGADTSGLAIGPGALTSQTANGEQNLAIGTNALHANTTGNTNIAIGTGALAAATTANGNIAIGINAMGSGSTTGSSSIGIGLNALQVNTGSVNVAIGPGALALNTTGSDNTVIGENAMTSNVTGSTETAVGTIACQQELAGGASCFGYDSGNAATVQIDAFGSQAAANVTTGAQNAAFGLNAMLGSSGTPTTGTRNAAFGNSALSKLVGAGAGNTAVGYLAGAQGVNALTTGTDNIYIGASTAPSSATATNEIVIGWQAIGQGNNTANIGTASTTDVYLGTSPTTAKIHAGAYTTGTNCSSSAAPAVCGSAAAGSVVVAAAGTTVTVNTTAVTANSQIFLLADDTLGTKLGVTCNSTLATLVGGLAVTARTGGTSFQITSGTTPAVNPLCLSYFIVN